MKKEEFEKKVAINKTIYFKSISIIKYPLDVHLTAVDELRIYLIDDEE